MLLKAVAGEKELRGCKTNMSSAEQGRETAAGRSAIEVPDGTTEKAALWTSRIPASTASASFCIRFFWSGAHPVPV